MPTIYGTNIDVPPSLLPTTPTSRKSPTDRSKPDELGSFRKCDAIKSLTDITETICPAGYKIETHDDKAVILYKMETINNIPQVTETIVIDSSLHVKLYKKSIPIPLPQWFRKGGDCCLKSKSTLENFPPYIRNYGDVDTPDPKNIPRDILDELQNLKYKRNSDGPRFSPSMMRYALLLYYTSPQAYRMLLEQLPFFFPRKNGCRNCPSKKCFPRHFPLQ